MNNQDHKDFDLALMFGRLEGKFDGMAEEMKDFKLDIKEIKKQVGKHENMWAKIAGMTAGFGVFSSVIFSWLRERFHWPF